MSVDPQAARKSLWPKALVAIAVSALLFCMGSWLLFQKLFPILLMGDTGWSEDAVPIGAVERVYGVRLEVTPLTWHSRSVGFQDHTTEVLFELPPGAEATFLGRNGLSRDPGGLHELHHVEREVRGLLRTQSPVTTTPLKGLKDVLSADGGSIFLYRTGGVFEVDGRTVFYLQAFDT